jgi:hypothetical protein
MNERGGHYFFCLTRWAWRAYKDDEPIYRTGNARSEYGASLWDVDAGTIQWFGNVTLLFLAFAADLVSLPFLIIYRAFTWRNRQEAAEPGQREKRVRPGSNRGKPKKGRWHR